MPNEPEKAKFQMDYFGHHRIVVGDKIGNPALYEDSSFLEKDGKWYMAVTQYYAGDLPIEMTEKVFMLEPVPTEAEMKECEDFLHPEGTIVKGH